MKPGNKAGLVSCLALLIAWPTSTTSSARINLIGIVLTWAAMLGWIVAGALRPRWWFLPPIALLGCYIWLLSLGH